MLYASCRWFFFISFFSSSSSFNFLLGKSHAFLGSGLTVWPGTEVPRVLHTIHMPKGVRACSMPAADLPVCGSSASPALWGSVPGAVDYLLVWWERGLHGPPEASGACGIHRSLCSWGFLPFFCFSASPKAEKHWFPALVGQHCHVLSLPWQLTLISFPLQRRYLS